LRRAIRTQQWSLRMPVVKTEMFSVASDEATPSRGIVVLQKCASPVCCAQFRYLHQGRLFEVEVQYFDSPSETGQSRLGNGRGRIERWWLCDQCADYMTLRFDRERGGVMVCSFGDCAEKPVILQSNGRAAAEIQRILIRPLDLQAVRRKAAIELKVKTREIA
jgi:hypothetical protein